MVGCRLPSRAMDAQRSEWCAELTGANPVGLWCTKNLQERVLHHVTLPKRGTYFLRWRQVHAAANRPSDMLRPDHKS